MGLTPVIRSGGFGGGPGGRRADSARRGVAQAALRVVPAGGGGLGSGGAKRSGWPERAPVRTGGSQRPGGPHPNDDWALNDEAIKNLGYMQMKKTHDAAMVLIQRMYGERPRYNYYVGTSQGGREALTVAQRYPADYDGVAANVPIVNFSTLMLAPELIRIQEKPRPTG